MCIIITDNLMHSSLSKDHYQIFLNPEGRDRLIPNQSQFGPAKEQSQMA
ncbi:hypothetical protein ES319_D13G209700v1 [Gossypium barbadense]|uniref:Uncharacterized protein n=2 Tax=Gossypium TaxID=3633 RepID=A0A5J5NPI8_GOSBA|nr:hypothetical protein ES319_D13G209700v1 [Gossypium barbadense]TYG38425.1 hypothetical protein ES288_D13G222000v1 [Gossypium darwinii]